MLRYLLKRFMMALPILWLLLSLVFILSRMLPGSFGSARIIEDSPGFYSKASAASREGAYREYLRRTGQHLPFFYFTVKASPEPDTLKLIQEEHDRLFLRRLSWHYGNPSLVLAYFNQIKQLEEQFNTQEKTPRQYQQTIYKLYNSITPDALLATTASLADAFPYSTTQTLQRTAKLLVKHQQKYNFLLPSFDWNGIQNQYHQWLIQLLQGNLGFSYRDNRPVTMVIGEAIGNTWWLIFTSIVITFVLALELSIFMVQHQKSKWHRFILPVLFAIDSIPLFVMALLLLVLLASPSFFQLFPVFGMGYFQTESSSWIEAVANKAPFMVLPILCLVLSNLPYVTNQIYRALTDATQAGYTKTAQAKGLSYRKVIRKHALRNALLPVITMLSDFMPALVAGAVVIETIFAIPGMGSLTITAVQARDYPVIIALVLVIAGFKILANLLADLFYGLADPRIRFASI